MSCTCPSCGHIFEPNAKHELGAESGFVTFWTLWPSGPRKGGKAACLAIWKRKRFAEQAREICAHVEREKQSESWQTGFVPMPRTYLNQMRWDGADEGDSDLLGYK
jgi:hypothetical protein